MSQLRREDVAKVAALARLSLTDVELENFTAQLSQVLDHAADMSGLDLSGLAPTAHPFGLTNVVRPDVVGPTVDRDAVLAAAPEAREDRFVVPRILGEAP
jgi:aspartyl-tRNA(Asn)/glutamyl-tRNA(Gln) amidotransferase subunit C